jgi:hypothetical protein
MPARAFLSVSKRLQPAVATVLCIAAMQLATQVVSGVHRAPMPLGAVRVALRP